MDGKEYSIPVRAKETSPAGSVSRRGFLAAGAGAAFAACHNDGNDVTMDAGLTKNPVSFGLVADLHYAEKDAWNTRCYRDSGDKLRACVETLGRLGADFIVELGDFVDKADKETEYGYLATIDGIFSGFPGDRHYVLGNHDVATFSKTEFIRGCGARKNYYSFDFYGTHFIVLDANYRMDGVPYDAGNFDWTDTIVPDSEIRWLEYDLGESDCERAIVFIHQNLHDENDPHGVKNAPDVRAVLDKAGTVAAVFQGHMHSGGYTEVGGIPYVTLRA
ncbi:MAG: metallophosphoesterase, partial [Candidatus Latescibacteria bacterium]|nr:metallophosphoesterase [Candidatus Latescibacterota bacterium]